MKRRILSIAACLLTASMAFAQSSGNKKGVPLDRLRYAGPFPAQNPVMIDQKDVKASEFDESKLLDISIKQSLLENGQKLSTLLPQEEDGGTIVLPTYDKSEALHLIGFNIENNLYTGVTISVKGIRKYQLFVDRPFYHFLLELRKNETCDFHVKYE